MRISARIASLSGSATLALDARVQELRKAGADIVDFGAGQPDFPTPDRVKEAAYGSIRDNRTRYTPAAGMVDTREAVAGHLERDFSLAYDPKGEILVTNGAKQAIFNAVHALVEPGDEVILFSPYWVSYPEQVRSAGATPVVVPTEDCGFRIDPERLAAAVTDRTKLLIVNSPSNPAGTVFTKADLEQIARVAIENDLAVISDEIYGGMTYDGSFVPLASLGSEIRERTVTVGAVSKTYSMTGWRLGWAAGPADGIRAMSRLQSHSTSNACTISQWAAIEALGGDQTEVAERNEEYRRRRDCLMERIASIEGLECAVPSGAFFAFPNVERFLGGSVEGKRLNDSIAFAEACLEMARVAVVPGIAFGSERYVRVSYATSLEQIEEGMDRLGALLAKVRVPA